MKERAKESTMQYILTVMTAESRQGRGNGLTFLDKTYQQSKDYISDLRQDTIYTQEAALSWPLETATRTDTQRY